MKVFAKNIVLAATVLTNNVIAEEAANPFKDEKETFEKDNAETRKLERAGRFGFFKAKAIAKAYQSLPKHIAERNWFLAGALAVAVTKGRRGSRMLRGRNLSGDADSVLAGCSATGQDNGNCNVECVQAPLNSSECLAYKASIDAEVAKYGYVSEILENHDGDGCTVTFSIPPTGLHADEEYAVAGIQEMNRCLEGRRRLSPEERQSIIAKRKLNESHEPSALVQATDAALSLHYYGQENLRRLWADGGEDWVYGRSGGTFYAVMLDTQVQNGECKMSTDVVWPPSTCSETAANLGRCTGTPNGDVCTVECTTSDMAIISILQNFGVCQM